MVRAALAGAPYLLRLQQWDTASALLQQALFRDASPGTRAAVLPLLERLADANRGTDLELNHQRVLAAALSTVDPGRAEALLRQVLHQTEDRQQHDQASMTAAILINLLRDAGQPTEALSLVEQKIEHTRQAGFGPWTQLADQTQRLQILYRMGQTERVLDEVQQLREHMSTLPAQPGENERVNRFNVREAILELGGLAARDLQRYEEALKLNADVLASAQRRGAGEHELARTAFNNYGPLLRLGRLDDADSLLQGCQSVFEQTGDTDGLGRTLSARANLAEERGHLPSAVNLERAALRHKYVQPDAHNVAVNHHNLANYLAKSQAAPDVWLGHRLAAALLDGLTGMTGQLQSTLRALAWELRNPAVAAALPATVQQLREQVDLTPGVRFGALLDAVQPDPAAQQTALDGILHAARTMPDEQLYDPQRAVKQWEPLLAGIVAAVDGDTAVAEDVQRALDGLADSPDWGALVVVLRRVLAGEREPQSLLSRLDPVDTAIVTRLLDALAGRTELHPAPPASSAGRTGQELPEQWQQTIATVIAAIRGDQSAPQALQPLLEQLTDDPNRAALATALRAVLAGDRDPDRLLAGLDEFDTTVVQTILAVLGQQADVPS